MNLPALQSALDPLAEMDCRDRGCIFAKTKTGQRTNSGCRCLESYHVAKQVRALVDAVSKVLAEEKRL